MGDRPSARHWVTRGAVLLFASAAIFLALSFLSYNPSDISFLTSHPQRPVANLGGTIGAWLAFAARSGFGWASLFLPVLFLFWTARFIMQGPVEWRGIS